MEKAETIAFALAIISVGFGCFFVGLETGYDVTVQEVEVIIAAENVKNCVQIGGEFTARTNDIGEPVAFCNLPQRIISF